MAEIRIPILNSLGLTDIFSKLKNDLNQVSRSGGGDSNKKKDDKDISKNIGFMAIAANQAIELLTKIFRVMIDFSPSLKGTLKILGLALGLFFRPFGNALGTIFMPMAKDLLDLSKEFGNLVNLDFFKENIKGATDIGGQIGEAIGGKSGKTIGKLAGGAVGVPFAIGAEVGKKLGEDFGNWLKGWMLPLTSQILDFWNNNIMPIWNTIAGALSVAWNGVNFVWNMIEVGLQTAWKAINIVWGTIEKGLQGAWDLVATVWTDIQGGLDSFWKFIEPVFAGLQRAFQGFVDFLKTLPFVGNFFPTKKSEPINVIVTSNEPNASFQQKGHGGVV